MKILISYNTDIHADTTLNYMATIDTSAGLQVIPFSIDDKTTCILLEVPE